MNAVELKPIQMKDVLSALSYVKNLRDTLIVVKLGGAILQKDEILDSVAQDLALTRSVGIRVVVVHGGGPAINQELGRRGITWQTVDGLRVTTPEMMEVVESVLVGSVNRRIVRALHRAGLRAVGFSGADATSILCKQADARLGLVGEVERINPQLIHSILGLTDELGQRAIPVIAPVGIGRSGQTYNINADWVASCVAATLGVSKMLFLTDQDGVLDSEGKLVAEIDAGDLEQFIEDGTVKGGMLAKAKTVLHAVRSGVQDVHIMNGQRSHAILEELFTDQGVGTICRLRARLR